jgi:hypothetical protein
MLIPCLCLKGCPCGILITFYLWTRSLITGDVFVYHVDNKRHYVFWAWMYDFSFWYDHLGWIKVSRAKEDVMYTIRGFNWYHGGSLYDIIHLIYHVLSFISMWHYVAFLINANSVDTMLFSKGFQFRYLNFSAWTWIYVLGDYIV